jgi:flagellar motor switch protein FliM
MESRDLSQPQIDKMFSQGAEGAVATAEPGDGDASANMRVYDFHRPNLISKDRLRGLEAKYGILCKAMENWLATRVRASVEMRLLGVEQFSYGEFTLSLPNPTASYIFDVAGVHGPQVVVDFGRNFAFYLVDRLLGSNEPLIVPDRGLTVVERLVVRFAADQVAAQLDEIWKSHLTLGLTFSRFESVPELLRTANREDPVLVANIEVRAPQLEGTLLLCIPFGVIEMFLLASGSPQLPTGRASSRERQGDRVRIEASLRTANVQVAVRTPPCNIRLADLTRLQPGASLRTGLPASTELIVHIEDAPLFIAQAGRSGNAIALRILDSLQPVASDRDESKRRPAIMAAVTDTQGKEDLAQSRPGADGALGSLYQVTLPITIELGRTRMTVQEVLELGRGSVITLERLVGEPVDVIVGDRHFADGEVVVIGEQFGVRITRIHAPQPGSGETP